MRDDATFPLVRMTTLPGEAGSNGGNSEPNRESLQAEISMSKETEPVIEPSLWTTANVG